MEKVYFSARLLIVYPAVFALATWALVAIGNELLDIKLAPVGASIFVLIVWYVSLLCGAKDFIKQFKRLDP